jgi:hypothetical protein
MELPLWLICIILIIIIVIYFVIVQISSNTRLLNWEKRASEILDECGFEDITKPRIIKSNSTYCIGIYNNENIVTSATIYLYVESAQNKLNDNEIIKSLIKQLVYIILPKEIYNSIIFYNTIEKLSFYCATKYKIDPFL